MLGLIKLVYPCTYRELRMIAMNKMAKSGISLYLQGTRVGLFLCICFNRYIPVPTGNSVYGFQTILLQPVYPCTYRELNFSNISVSTVCGISLYLQGTLELISYQINAKRYIPVPTGNSTTD